MYELINTVTGEKVNVENPRYVKKNQRGIWVKCQEQDAQCIAVGGVRYSIFDKIQIEDAPEVLIIKEVDSGEQLQNLRRANAEELRERLKQAETLEEVKHCIEDIYSCLLDLYDEKFSEV